MGQDKEDFQDGQDKNEPTLILIILRILKSCRENSAPKQECLVV